MFLSLFVRRLGPVYGERPDRNRARCCRCNILVTMQPDWFVASLIICVADLQVYGDPTDRQVELHQTISPLTC
jgi:hypothetical protein